MIRVRLALICLLLIGGTAADAAGPKVAIFPFELIDDSLEGQYLGPQPQEAVRLVQATDELRKLVESKAGYEVVDLGGIAAEIEKAKPLYKCEGCEVELARRAGAELAMTLAVRKFSSMLLSFHVYLRDVSSGTITRMYRIDVRGNTDDSWSHGVRRLVADGLAGK